jgi:hypothetical protein
MLRLSDGQAQEILVPRTNPCIIMMHTELPTHPESEMRRTGNGTSQVSTSFPQQLVAT